MAQTRKRRAGLLPGAQIEYLILADSVEALNGKLYMMGGGWDTLFVRDVNAPVALSFALGVEVPWGVTDDDHTLSAVIRDPDGTDIAPPLSITLRTGRPPTLERGASMHVPFAIKGEFKFPGYGQYAINATVDGAPGRQFTFTVKTPPGQPQPQVPGNVG